MKDAQQKAAKMGDPIRSLYVVGGDAFAVPQNGGEIFRYDEVIRIAREMAHEAINQTRGNINRKAKEALKRFAEITGEEKHG